jgi:hypothetical protein
VFDVHEHESKQIGEWPRGVSPRGSRRTGREARTSSGSRYPTSRRAIRQ